MLGSGERKEKSVVKMNGSKDLYEIHTDPPLYTGSLCFNGRAATFGNIVVLISTR
jgi:hypothetical protein